MACTSWDENQTGVRGNTIRLTGDPVFVRLNADVAEVRSIAVTGVTFDRTSESLEAGERMQLVPQIAPYNAKNRKTTWTSANAAIAKVDHWGTVTAIAPGKTTITVTTDDGRQTAVCHITVVAKMVDLQYILISSGYISMKAGEAHTLEVSFFPADATNKNLVWKTSNEKIVTVDPHGRLRGIAAGKANVSVAPEGEAEMVKNCIVQVSN
jgi:uncharacterized protein YjdB